MPDASISRRVVTILAGSLFALCCVAPVIHLVTSATTVESGSTVAWLDSRQQRLLGTTALLASGTAVLATIVGVPLGFALSRTRLLRRSWIRAVLAAPIVLPPYVAGLAWTYLTSRHGLLATSLGYDALASWTYSLPAAIVVLALIFYPVSMLATEVALRRIDVRLEEAGLLHASPAATLRRITLPLTMPTIVGAALVIFVLAVSEFGVPALLRVPVYTTEIFTAFAALYDVGRAVSLAVPLIVVTVLIASSAAALLQEPQLTTRRGSSGFPQFFEAATTPLALIGLIVAGSALVSPIGVLLLEAADARVAAHVVEGSAAAIANSLIWASIAATVVTAIAVPLGYTRARATRRVGWLADALFLAVFAVPSTIVGVALIGMWNRSGPLGHVYGTDGMLLLAYIARCLPVAAIILAATTRYVPASHEEAASVCGSGWLRTQWRIVLPQMRAGLLVAWVLSFVLASGELGASILVTPAGDSTLPIRVYTLIANTPSSHVAALALLQAFVVFVPLLALTTVVSRCTRP